MINGSMKQCKLYKIASTKDSRGASVKQEVFIKNIDVSINFINAQHVEGEVLYYKNMMQGLTRDKDLKNGYIIKTSDNTRYEIDSFNPLGRICVLILKKVS